MKVDSKRVFWLKKNEIDQAVNQEYRQYFIGNLGRPQLLDHLEEGDLEIGTSLYKDAKADAPHQHLRTHEILYILQGTFIVLILETMEEYVLSAGDFFVIPPLTPYASKACAGTQTLFIKTGGNDKAEVQLTEEQHRWIDNLVI